MAVLEGCALSVLGSADPRRCFLPRSVAVAVASGLVGGFDPLSRFSRTFRPGPDEIDFCGMSFCCSLWRIESKYYRGFSCDFFAFFFFYL
uniref:Uncharacterized protein n=1 Tax=Arundo donax TaxID=35708 RepID=A0A0A9E6T1_ARUDO